MLKELLTYISQKDWEKEWQKPIHIIFLFLIFFSVNILCFVWFKSATIDITDEGRFSVSPDIQKLVQKIPERVDVKLYISDVILSDMPSLKSYAERIQDYLEQLSEKSDGKLFVTKNVIESFSEQEDEAVALGLKQLPLKDGRSVFFGVVAENMLDTEGVIPFISPEREKFIEYDIARLLQGLIKTDQITVAITSSLPLETGFGGQEGLVNGTSKPYHIFQALRDNYNLIGLSKDYQELVDAKQRPHLALILHPYPLSEKAQNNLSEYLNQGGRAIVAFDPYSEVPAGSQQKPSLLYSELSGFLKKYGLIADSHDIVIDKNHARKIINPNTSKPEAYLTWLKFGKDNINPDSPALSSLSNLSFSTTGTIVKDAQYKGEFMITPLLFSIEKGGVLSRESLLKITDITTLQKYFKPTSPYMIAAMVSGQVENGKKMGLVAIADTDFLDDRLWLQTITDSKEIVPYAENMNMILNLVDYLTGDDSLLSLRGEKIPHRPLTYLENIKETAQEKYLIQEQELQERIQSLRDKIKLLTDGTNSTGKSLSLAVKTEVQKFSYDIVELRQKLRHVRREMSLQIKQTEQQIKMVNIILTPFIFAIFAAVIFYLRKKKFLTRKVND